MTSSVFRGIVFIVTALMFQCARAEGVPNTTAKEEYIKLTNALMASSVDPERVANVSNISFKRDAATFTLTSGKLYVMKPLHSRTPGVVFTGNGRFTFTPPTNIEKEQLRRHIASDTATIAFSSLVLFFADSTMTELSRYLRFDTDNNVDEANHALANLIQHHTEPKVQTFDDDILMTFLNNVQNTFFDAIFKEGANGAEYLYRVNPDDVEEIGFFREYTQSIIGSKRMFTINLFHTANEYREGIDLEEDKRAFNIIHYDMNVTMDKDFTARFAVTINAQNLIAGRRWLRFAMNTLKNDKSTVIIIDSILWDGKNETDNFFYDGRSLWVRATKPLDDLQKIQLTVYYNGTVFRRYRDEVYMETGYSTWYPRNYDSDRATFLMNINSPVEYNIAAAGRKVTATTVADTLRTSWVVEVPSEEVSFALGVYRERTYSDNAAAPVKLLYDNQSTKHDNVGNDVARARRYFSEWLGKPPFDSITVVEKYRSYGLFPGMIFMSHYSFSSSDKDGSEESFAARLIATQWWITGAGVKTYHDTWLQFALTNYCGLMYLQSIGFDNKSFFGFLRENKKRLKNLRVGIVGGLDEAPLWMGWRTATSTSNSDDYNRLLYNKGSWIIHMIRNMMMDVQTLNDQKFRAMMRDFYTTYNGKNPTTHDFQVMVEKHMNQKMDWFFNQWVYGTRVPKYKVAYKVNQSPEGKYIVTMKVKTENVPSNYMMPVLISANFGDKGSAPIRVLVQGTSCEFDLPMLPHFPEKIDFNILESVLCDYEMVEWE
ncbi:MAG: hypothetical protein JNL32_01285 [Candidatus Kapabacteria bacterium]|nr:hypothetical protein [Candidatus Kapabacteria bacterium]